MRFILFCLFFVVISPFLISQEQSIAIRADSAGILRQNVLTQYDSHYLNSAKLDSAASLASQFGANFCSELRTRLEHAGFTLKDTTFVHITLYCAPTGRVEHCVYLSKALPYDREGIIFQDVLEKLARGFSFSADVHQRFWQCGTLRFPEL